MDLIVIDNAIGGSYQDDIQMNKFENFERIQEVYLNLSKTYTESSIQEYINDVTIIIRKAMNMIEAGEDFFIPIRKYLTGFVNDLKEFSRQANNIDGEIKVKFNKSTVKIEEFLEIHQNKFKKIVNETIQLVEEKQDQLIEKRFQSENAFTDFKGKYETGFKKCCYWLLEKQFLTLLGKEMKNLEEFSYVLITIELILNDLEYIKFLILDKIFECLREKFCVEANLDRYCSQNFGFIHKFGGGEMCEGSKEFLIKSGIVFYKIQQRSFANGVVLEYTLDNFLHFFKSQSEVFPFLTISLKEFKHRFFDEEGEYYLEIFKDKVKYLVRFKNNSNYQEWRRVFIERY